MQPLHNGWKRSLRPDAGRADHLAPLFGFIGDVFAKFGGRTADRPSLIATGGKGSANPLRESAFTFNLVS
jgi:hypothetical protein